MKLVISDTPPYFIDVAAPVIGCDELVIDGQVVWRFRCKHCGHDHFHGPGDGHREAHCDPGSPYHAGGYNLTLASPVRQVDADKTG